MSVYAEKERAEPKLPRINKTTPIIKNFFKPNFPANFPNGTEKIAIASKNEVANQLSKIASITNCSAIEGNATVIAEVENAVTKDVNADKNTIRFLEEDFFNILSS